MTRILQHMRCFQRTKTCRLLTAAPLTSALWFAAIGCDHRGAQQASTGKERPPAPVTVAEATTQDVPVYIDQIGKIVPIEAVTILPQVGGKIMAVHFTDGAYVKKGDLLFEIDPRPFQAALAAARAALDESKAQFSLASDELKRYTDAVASKAVSELEYTQKYNAKVTAEARVHAFEAAVETAKLNLEYASIHSPIDGRAGARLVDPGNVVRENTTPLLSIQRLDPIYAEFTITEKNLERVRSAMKVINGASDDTNEKGLTVEVALPEESAVAATPPMNMAPATMPAMAPTTTSVSQQIAEALTPHRGELTFLDNTVNPDTGTIKLRATVPNNDRFFWPGQFVNVRLILREEKGAILIPAEAQQIGQQGPYVYVVNSDDIAELKPIVPGQRQGDLLVVQRGVQLGDRVIVGGHMTVVPQHKVMILPPGGMPPGMGGPMMGSPEAKPPSDKKPASGGTDSKGVQQASAKTSH